MTVDATEQARMVREREVSPSELLEQAIRRIEALNPHLNAVVHPLFDEAREAAAGVLPAGPFRGVPFLVKDAGCYMAGAPVHEGVRALRDLGYRADHDMWLTRRLRAAGFVLLGRTNTSELSILPTAEPEAYGPTRNPGVQSIRRAGRVAVRPPRWPRGWFPLLMPAMAAGRSGFPPATAASSA